MLAQCGIVGCILRRVIVFDAAIIPARACRKEDVEQGLIAADLMRMILPQGSLTGQADLLLV